MGKSLGARFLWPTVYYIINHSCCLLSEYIDTHSMNEN